MKSIIRKAALAAVLASVAVGAWSVQSASALATTGTIDADAGDVAWICFGADHINLGVCQDNPLPSKLPVAIHIAEG